MDNYIVISHITDQRDADYFDSEVKNNFPKHQEDSTGPLTYLGFAARERAAVEDKFKEILHQIGIGHEDYVALYYTKEGDEDAIVRAMLLGHDTAIENDLQDVNPEEHVDVLSRLLNHDFTKSQ